MKHLKKTFILLFSLCIFGVSAIAQQNCHESTSTGTDFWLMFLYNGGDQTPHITSLTVVGDSNATITVANPTTGWSTTEALTANQSVQIDIPIASSITTGSNDAQTKRFGIHVTSTSHVSVYATNYKFKCNDLTQVYPSHTLGTHYMIQDYPGDPSRGSLAGAEVGFVAALDSTTLTMVLPCNLINSSASSGDTLTINLMQGESYQLITQAPGSFSGMEVSSNGKPFAAFQGNRVAYIPTGATGADLIYEQAVPIDQWGTDYMVVPTFSRIGDQLRITSSENDCQLYTDGNLTITLQKGDSYEVALSSAHHYTSTQKICVGRYLRSTSSGGDPGDPSSVILPSVDQGLQNLRFVIPSSSDINNHYLNIISDNSFVADITLDGNSISNQFTQFDNDYSYAQIRVFPGVHLLTSPQGPIIADYNGLGSYASKSCLVGRSFCIIESQDTTPIVPEPQVHRDTTSFIDTVCQGHAYNSNGFSIDADETQVITTLSRMDSTVVDDTIVHYRELTLTVLPTTRSEETRILVAGDTLIYYGDTLTIAGEYTITDTTANGCDHIITLHLRYQDISLSASSDGLCPGESVTLTAEGTHTYQWDANPTDSSLLSQQGQNPVTVHPDTTTVYSLLDASGIVIASVTVHVDAPPIICIERNRTFIDFDHPVLALHDCSENRHHTAWDFNDGYHLIGERARRVYHHPLPDTVTVTMTTCTKHNCCADTTLGFVPKIRSIWFPNIFFPDQESNNRFGCYTSYEVAEFELEIFNRWGFFVWSTTDIDIQWDGTHEGEPMPQDAYVYKWFLKDIYGDHKTGVGTVTLVR